jgi:hypothetical protein
VSTLKFEVTMEEGNLLVAALAKQPFEAVAGLINKLQQQAQVQLAPPAEPPKEAAKAE